MKEMDLLKNLGMADPRYVEEASDRSLLLYRRRQKRTRFAVAACLAGVMLAGAVLAKPVLYAWETRNTVASWRDNGGFVYLEFDKPSPSVFVSAEMPAQKKFAAEAPFTLSVGMGQVSDYAYATLSVKAEGFEITDKEGNTVTDRYVRTLSDFNNGNYGVLYRDGKPAGPVTGCSYLEDFTLRYVGGENAAGWGVISFSLTSRRQSSTMGDAVAVYYTVQNGVLKLTDKRPAEGGGGLRGELTEETEDGTVTLSAEDIAVNVRMDTAVFTPFLYFGDGPEITARYKANSKEYPTDRFTAELVYAESLRERDYSFFLKKPAVYTEDGHTVVMVPRVPVDAPVGSYDLRITDPETGFVWVLTDMAWVLPELPDGSGIPAYGDFVCEAEEVTHTPRQGDSEWGFGELFTLTEKGEDVSFLCRAHLEYAGDTGEEYTVVLAESGFSSVGAVSSFVPADAPSGPYDLVITHGIYGYTWRFKHYVEVEENPQARLFGLYHSMGQRLTVRRSAEMEYTFVAKVENRGKPFTLTVTEDERFMPKAALTGILYTDSDTVPAYPIYSPSGKFEACSIALHPLRETVTEPYKQTVTTGQTGSCTYRILVTPDTPCGIYDLILSYGDSKVVFRGVVEVVP